VRVDRLRRWGARAFQHPVLLAPFVGLTLARGVAVALGQAAPSLGAAVGYLVSLLTPAFLAWWMGMAWEVAEGRRVILGDVWDVLVRTGPMTYLVLFVAALGPGLASSLLGGVGAGLAAMAVLGLNPWLDLLAAGHYRVDEAAQAMRDWRYWLAAGLGLVLAVGAVALAGGFIYGVLPWPPGNWPVPLARSLVVVAVASLLWVIREGLLQDAARGGQRRNWPYID
jgi:hypothetical protein